MLHKAAILLPLLLSGCALLAPQKGTRTPESNEAQEAARLASHLHAVDSALHVDAAAQAAVLGAAKQEWEQARQPSAGLRYALLLSMVEAPARDPLAAQVLLRDLLAHEQLPAAGERALAQFQLGQLDREFALNAEAQRLNTELAQERERAREGAANGAAARRLQTEIEENARLRRALDEARAKLDAITTIERRYTDRPPNEGRQP